MRQRSVFVKIFVDRLNLLYIVHYLVEILVLEFLVFMEECGLLHIPEDQRRNLLQIEFLITGVGENFVRIFVVHNDKNF